MTTIKQLTPTSKIATVQVQWSHRRWLRPEALAELAAAPDLAEPERAALLVVAESLAAEREWTRVMEEAEPYDAPASWLANYREAHPAPPSLQTWSDGMALQQYDFQGIRIQASGAWAARAVWAEEVVIASAVDPVWESYGYVAAG